MAGRAVQGVGAAFMMPATLSIITNAFPPEERGKAIGTWAGRLRARAGDRPGRRRRARRVRVLAGDLLPQPAGGGRAPWSSRCSRPASRATRRPATASTSPASRRCRSALTALVLALVEGNAWGWGSPEIIALLALSAVSARGLRAARAARARADGRLPLLPLEDVPRRERGRLHRDLLDAGDVLLHRALHAEHPRLLGRRGGRALPALDADDRADRAARRPADGPRRRPAADGRRALAHRRSRCCCRPASTSTPATGCCCPRSS